MGKIPERPNESDSPKNIGTNAQNDFGRFPQRRGLDPYWVLGEPESADADRRRFRWNKADEIRYESIRCGIDPAGHRRAGARITPLSVVLPDIEPYDFAWTPFECLIQAPVARFFEDKGFKGYEIVPAKTKFATSPRHPPQFWELVVTGSAGIISPQSGYSVRRICPSCGLIDDDARITDPTKVVDESNWDGTDFFRIKRISGWIFVTNRVVNALADSHFRGWKAYALTEMKESFDVAVPGHTNSQ